MYSLLSRAASASSRHICERSPWIKPDCYSIHLSPSWLSDKPTKSDIPVEKLIDSSVSETNFKTDKAQIEPSTSDIPVQKLLDSSVTETNFKPDTEESVWCTTPYDEYRMQSQKAYRPKIDPRETTIILFPGQGVQYVGMCKNLLKIPRANDLFQQANDILGYNLLKLCLEGPKEKLDKTVHCQPAVFVASLAALELMIESRRTSVESCIATAGFSVGEFASLVLAEALTFESALKLVKLRAEAMQTICEEIDSGMMTCFLEPNAKIGTIKDAALNWCCDRGVEDPVCEVANHLWPSCKVIAGHAEALKFIESNLRNLKIRKVKRIPVSGAFHTQLMKPAAEPFAEALSKCKIKDPVISVHSNVDGLVYLNAKMIRKKLPLQIYSPVKWEQTMHILYERKKGIAFPRTFECGPGKSLSSMLRFNNSQAAKETINIYSS